MIVSAQFDKRKHVNMVAVGPVACRMERLIRSDRLYVRDQRDLPKTQRSLICTGHRTVRAERTGDTDGKARRYTAC